MQANQYVAGSLPAAMQVRMRDLGVHVAKFPCGSLDIKVQSSGLLMTDTRKAGGSEAPVAVVNIGGMEDAAPVRCASIHQGHACMAVPATSCC